jgi:hypothetical protein
MTIQEKLERLHNRPTRYELIAERGETRILIAYCMRTGRHSILSACRQHGAALISFMGITDQDMITFPKPARLGAKIGDWRVHFSGRTQRESIQSELPWIGNLAQEHVEPLTKTPA